MEFDYYDFPNGMDGLAEDAFVGAAGLVAGIVMIVYLLLLAFSIVSYVLNAVGMYRIAKRRGIHHAWLAWIPVGNSWLLGGISDHYQYVAKKKITARRKALLAMNIILMVLSGVVMAGAALIFAFSGPEDVMGSSILLIGLLVIAYLALFGLSIAVLVVSFIAYYDLFQSSKPNSAVLFLILGVVFNVTLPFFVFACGNSDKGMPQRRPLQPVEQLCEEEAAPAEEFSAEQIPVVETEIVEDPE